MEDVEVLVLGGGFAGVNAAISAARKGFDVTLVDRDSCHEFTPGIIDLVRDRHEKSDLELDLEEFFSGTPVDFREEEVESIYPDMEEVETGENAYDYDYLVLALGGEPATYGLDISEVETAYCIRDVEELCEGLEDCDSVIIVGSGYVGMEMAGEFSEEALDVTVVDRATRPMSNGPEKCSQLALDYMNENGISFCGGKNVVELHEKKIEVEKGEGLEADMVVWAGGVQASSLVQESFDADPGGLDVSGGLVSKEYGNVFAVGDNADTEALKTAHHAERQGEFVAESISKSENEPLGEYGGGEEPLVVSLGDTALLLYGDRSLESRFFRRLKDIIMKVYWLSLKKDLFRLKFF